jgi:hypothetical protein
MGALVVSWAMDPTGHSSSSSSNGSNGSTSQWLVVAVGLLLLSVFVFVATALSSGTHIMLVSLPCL